MRRAGILVGLALILVLGNWAILQKEGVLSSGIRAVVELAPRDPRSLMQGDYMALRYAVPETVRKRDDLGGSGVFVMKNDERGVSHIVRKHEGEALQSDEFLLRYKAGNRTVSLGPSSYFFQEGKGGAYRAAKYGELRVDDSGHAVLIGLLDEGMKRLGSARAVE